MRLLLLSLFAVISLGLNAQVVISAVFDAPLSGGTPKGVELYVYENIADLSIYGLGSANNGGGTDGVEFTFPAVAVSAGTYIYVASETPEFTAWFGFAPDFTSSSMAVNGDDAIELFKSGVLFDLFGDPSVDGTDQAWEYMDGWASRNNGVLPSTTFNSSDWTFSGANALDGETSNATATSPVPIATTLPVTLTTLTATAMPKSTMVKWATASESENDFFAVERSQDGRTFRELGRVTGRGTTTDAVSYAFEDNAPVNGTSYYRLRQVDFDGTTTFSEFVLVQRQGLGLSAYPNPVASRLFLGGATDGEATIMDMNGRTLRMIPLTGDGIDVANLRAGTYLLRVATATGTETIRFVRK